MNIKETRELFPYLNTGRIYFNHAASGPISKKVLASIRTFLINCSEGSIDDYPAAMKITAETKSELGNYLNCSPDRIAFIDNTTNGINLLASGLNLKKGDRIILNDLEFPSNVYPFMNLQSKGVEIDFVKSHKGIVSAEEIVAAITPNTKLISVSQVQFLTGYRVNLKKIGDVCRAKNIVFCVDAIQGLGAVQIDVEHDLVDFISCGTQKWMLGLQGLSFVYVSEALQEKINPAYMGWLSVNDAWNLLDYKIDRKSSAELFQTGTLNTLGIYALHASLSVFKDLGYQNVQKLVLDNAEYLIEVLEEIGIQPFIKNGRENLSGIVSFRHPNAHQIFEQLEKKNITCAVREGVLRISPHFYNTTDEIDRFIEVLKPMI